MLTSYHTDKLNRKINHLTAELITYLFRYLFDCFEVFFKPIKYLRQFKWIPSQLSYRKWSKNLKCRMKNRRVLQFLLQSNFFAGYHFGVTFNGAFSCVFVFYVIVIPVSSVTSNADYCSVMPAERICKPGPPLKAMSGKTNCLIIGDSTSIG